MDCMISPNRVVHPFFPPVVAMELVRIACEMPEKLGRSLCLWDCTELANMLQIRGVVESISPQTVQRILYSNSLKPWRFHPWLRPKARDQEFIDRTKDICQLYTEPLPDPMTRSFYASTKRRRCSHGKGWLQQSRHNRKNQFSWNMSTRGKTH